MKPRDDEDWTVEDSQDDTFQNLAQEEFNRLNERLRKEAQLGEQASAQPPSE